MGHIFYSHLAHKVPERLIESARPLQENNIRPETRLGLRHPLPHLLLLISYIQQR